MSEAHRRSRVSILLSIMLAGYVAPLAAQQPQARISREINTSERATLRGSHLPMARPEYEAGRVASDARLEGISVVFRRSAAQEADLQGLIAAQHDPRSPLYQRWLTPEEFAMRFGMADADIAVVGGWLELQGFTVESVSRSKNQIMFSGSARQVETTFSTELHYYNVSGERHFAPSGELTIPAALSPVLEAVMNLSTFRPHPRVIQKGPLPGVQSHFTSGQSKNHFLAPKDVATIYNINPAYSSGLDGSGQAIAVVGQSAVLTTDIANFQTAAGFATKAPDLVLVPGTGASTRVSGDEAESDLDLEYSSTIAHGATIHFIYTGNNVNSNVWNSLIYAVQQKIAPIISISYGLCEPLLTQGQYNSLNGFLAQAVSQGQTVVAASGDGGSSDCAGFKGATIAQQQLLSVDFPASSQYVTGIGGTEFSADDVASTNTTYWSSSSGGDVLSSALSYIPEMAWNDSSASGGISASGGGVSTFSQRPSWQSGVSGIPTGTFRLVPDISLDASPVNAGYLYCSSDASTKVTGSCANGFRDSNNAFLTVAGGTSFGAPIFAGMMALINQKANSSQGLANVKLYGLAMNSGTYASVFHDVIRGTNNCSSAGATACPSSSAASANYAATAGFDQATGLGSFDFANLLSAWSGSSPGAKNFTIAATNTAVSAGNTGTSTITITPQNGYTGTVQWAVTSSASATTVCFSIENASISGSVPVTVSLTIRTSSSACASATMSPLGDEHFASALGGPIGGGTGPALATSLLQVVVGASGVLLLGMSRARARRSAELCWMVILLTVAIGTAACSSTSSPPSSGPSNAAKGNYTVTIKGTDAATSSITASTTMTLTIN